MSEHDTSSEKKNLPEEIDLVMLLDDLLRGMRHFTLQIILLAIALSAFFSWRSLRSFSPTYKAEADVTVASVVGDESQNQATANLLGRVFPYILTSGLLNDIVAEDLGRSSVPGSVSVKNIPNTPILTITVTSKSQEDAQSVLQSVITNYPKVAKYVVGNTTLGMISDVRYGVAVSSGNVLVKSIRNGCLIALLLGAMFGMMYSVSFRTIKTSKDLRAVVNASYLGTLPVYRKKKRTNSEHAGINILEANVQQSYLEALRQIRTRLDRRLKKHHAHVIMITSSIPGEGKSTVSSNLALAMAMNEKKILLVDCDIRNPSVQEVLNIKGEFPGIAKVLKGEVSFEEARSVYQNGDVSLDMIYGASESSMEISLLGSPMMEQFLEQAKKYYDYIILDTPPSAMLADAMVMSNYVDAAVYVIMCDYARRQYVIDGIEELTEAGVYIAGCIINAGKDESSGYGYGYKSGYGYGYYGYGSSKKKSSYYYGSSSGSSKSSSNKETA